MNEEPKKQSTAKQVLSYPRRLIDPIGSFLSDQLSRLERRQKEIEKDDPFQEGDRLSSKASIDADAAEQFIHARASAIRTELDRRIIQTKKALSRVKVGNYGICESCGEMIDTDRLMVYPEATFCLKCEKRREK